MTITSITMAYSLRAIDLERIQRWRTMHECESASEAVRQMIEFALFHATEPTSTKEPK